MKKKGQIEVVELKQEEVDAVLKRAKETLPEDDYELIKAVMSAYLYLLQLIEKGRTTIGRLQKIIFGAKSEKSSVVLKKESRKPPKDPDKKPKGHGRNGADAYRGAERIKITHETLKPGERCPECEKGKVYEQSKPGVLVRLVGQAPVRASVHEFQKFRCNLCGKIFTPPVPEAAKGQKYDPTVSSIIALQKYGYGCPFHRLESLQANLGVPLPSSTQWDLVSQASKLAAPAYQEIIRQAAQGSVLHNDDTSMKILDLCGKRFEELIALGKHTGERIGVFTSGIVSISNNQTIALFFTGNKHAGENLETVLRQRAAELKPPIQMCDALSRNPSKEFKTILANCITHGRRNFVDVVENFPNECDYVLTALREVYQHDAETKMQNMSPRKRLLFHQQHSEPIMDKLEDWLINQIEQKITEPNSGLGQAITYMLNHWKKLTLFLRKEGAPLDNNICERALKKAILHRKNAMFYRSENGALVGDTFMSLIYTAELASANPFDYLTQLQRHAGKVALTPSEWMPWNYQHSIAALITQKAA